MFPAEDILCCAHLLGLTGNNTIRSDNAEVANM